MKCASSMADLITRVSVAVPPRINQGFINSIREAPATSERTSCFATGLRISERTKFCFVFILFLLVYMILITKTFICTYFCLFYFIIYLFLHTSRGR